MGPEAKPLAGIRVLAFEQAVSMPYCTFLLSELAEDPRFTTVINRHRHREVLRPRIEELLKTKNADHWLERLRSAGIPCGRVRTIREALEHPQVVDHGLQVKADSEVGPVPVFRAPFAAARGGRRRIPALGESSSEVLAELGYTSHEILRLRRAGAVN